MADHCKKVDPLGSAARAVGENATVAPIKSTSVPARDNPRPLLRNMCRTYRFGFSCPMTWTRHLASPVTSPCGLRVDLEQAGSALAAADAHRHDAPLGAAALTLLQDVAGAARARHAERVTDRDRAAV